jgi:hypothetical protein
MAENIYSRGTRVWFEDKDHAWISGEVVSVTKAAADVVKLTFLDERGKVSSRMIECGSTLNASRRSQSRQPFKT